MTHFDSDAGLKGYHPDYNRIIGEGQESREEAIFRMTVPGGVPYPYDVVFEHAELSLEARKTVDDLISGDVDFTYPEKLAMTALFNTTWINRLKQEEEQ